MVEYRPLTLSTGQPDVDMVSTKTRFGMSLRMVMRDGRWKMIATNSRNGLSKTIDAGRRETPEQIRTMMLAMATASRQYGVEWLDTPVDEVA